jgi:tRNA acetyltransferase TAN1
MFNVVWTLPSCFADRKLTMVEVVFFKTIAPVEPTTFVERICQDAMNDPQRKRTRTAKRLAPMTLIGRASAEGLEKAALEVLAPHFHHEGVAPRTVSSIQWFALVCERSY